MVEYVEILGVKIFRMYVGCMMRWCASDCLGYVCAVYRWYVNVVAAVVVHCRADVKTVDGAW